MLDEALRNAAREAQPSPYFDDSTVLDAGSLAFALTRRCASLASSSTEDSQPTVRMTTISTSLSVANLPTVENNTRARRELSEMFERSCPGAVYGIFGKTIWAFESAHGAPQRCEGSSALLDPFAPVSDALGPDDFGSLLNLHTRGWLASVATAVRRRTAGRRHLASDVVLRGAVEVIVDTPWRNQDAVNHALSLLKAFTQPSWWARPLDAPPESPSRDGHIPSLLNETAYRQAVRSIPDRTKMLYVTDVPGLFLGSIRTQADLGRASKGVLPSRPGIAGRILAAIATGADWRSMRPLLMQARSDSAAELAASLTKVAICARSFGGEAFYTHGDGLTVILPTEAAHAFESHVTAEETALPIAIGSVPLGQSVRAAQASADRATRVAKAQMATTGEWVAHHAAGADIPRAAAEGRRRWTEMASSDGDAVESWVGRKATTN